MHLTPATYSIVLYLHFHFYPENWLRQSLSIYFKSNTEHLTLFFVNTGSTEKYVSHIHEKSQDSDLFVETAMFRLEFGKKSKYAFLQYGVIPEESWVFSDRVAIKPALMLIEPTKQKLHSEGGRAKFQVGLVTSTKFLYGTNWKIAARITTICFTKGAKSTWD